MKREVKPEENNGLHYKAHEIATEVAPFKNVSHINHTCALKESVTTNQNHKYIFRALPISSKFFAVKYTSAKSIRPRPRQK